MWNSSSGSRICRRNVSKPFFRIKLCSSYISCVARVAAIGASIRCNRCSLVRRNKCIINIKRRGVFHAKSEKTNLDKSDIYIFLYYTLQKFNKHMFFINLNFHFNSKNRKIPYLLWFLSFIFLPINIWAKTKRSC